MRPDDQLDELAIPPSPSDLRFAEDGQPDLLAALHQDCGHIELDATALGCAFVRRTPQRPAEMDEVDRRLDLPLMHNHAKIHRREMRAERRWG
jgi:hypothetical protein